MTATGRCRSVLRDVRAFVVYADDRIDHDATDYALVLTDQLNWSMLTAEQEINNLIAFLRHLDSKRIAAIAATDAVLADFRDAEYARVRKRGNSTGAPRKAMATVNKKLMTVYRYLVWLCHEGRSEPTLVGPSGCQVCCESFWPPGRRVARGSSIFPLLYRHTGASSRHRTGFVPDRESLDRLSATLMQSDEYIGRRNSLFVDIAAAVGLRRASINSLTIDQFDADVLRQTTKESVLIRPSSQKFGYENDFHFPVWLALHVLDFIHGPRANLMNALGAGESTSRNRVFISARNGRPLTDRALTQQVSRAARRIGAPRGASVHSLRAYFLNNWIEMEITRRLEVGLDTSTASIAAAGAMVMGHKNPDSIFAYVARAQSLRGVSSASEQRNEMHRLRKRIADLEWLLEEAKLSSKR